MCVQETCQCSNQTRLGQPFPWVKIGSLPDNVLLDIFDYCKMPWFRWWHALVHVCRRWRCIVFESPLRLDLQLVLHEKTPVKKTLEVWPRSFPIIIAGSILQCASKSGDNIIAALEHHDRVSEIHLYPTCTGLNRLFKEMKKPYPVLTRLYLYIRNWTLTSVLRDTFLGGSAPLLRDLTLIGVPFPGLPTILPLFPNLVNVLLRMIPNSGYISPEAMATALSALANLKSFEIGFESPPSRPDPTNRPPSPSTRIILHALTHLKFHGASEYFEDLVARIDTPAIISVDTSFIKQLGFDIPHFIQFIGRTQISMSCEEATLFFAGNHYAFICLTPLKELWTALSITISCDGLDRQFGLLAQICGHITPFLVNVERLWISNPYPDDASLDWKEFVNNPQWLGIFHAFPAVKHMRILPGLGLGEIIASALQELTGERVMDALPMLHHLYLHSRSTFTQQAIQPFIASRQRSDHPVIVHLPGTDLKKD